VPDTCLWAKVNVCGRYLREEEGCGCVHELAHRRDEQAAGSGRGRNLREESVLLGGTTGHGYRSGPQAGCQAVCFVVVSTWYTSSTMQVVCRSSACGIPQDKQPTVALHLTGLLLEQTYLLSLSMTGNFCRAFGMQVI
jgi:hypothetical protein